jgi:hypothetical protein
MVVGVARLIRVLIGRQQKNNQFVASSRIAK